MKERRKEWKNRGMEERRNGRIENGRKIHTNSYKREKLQNDSPEDEKEFKFGRE